jgi:Spy/CpxP family protein refolding chaperone
LSATERSTTKKTVVIAALALVVTFVAGFIVGAVVDRFVMFHRRPHRPPPMAAFAMMNRLDRQLDLNDQQRTQIRAILERHHGRITGAVRAELDETNLEIEKVLTPEQRAKFQTLKMRLGPGMHRGDTPRKAPTR